MDTTFHDHDRVRSRIDSLPTRDELLGLVSRAEEGSSEAQHEVRRLLDEHEELWEVAGDVSRLLESHLIGILAGNSAILREAIARKIARLRGDLTDPDDGVLEFFLVDRVVNTFLDLAIRHVRATEGITATEVRRLDRHLSRSQRRHLDSIQALREFRERKVNRLLVA